MPAYAAPPGPAFGEPMPRPATISRAVLSLPCCCSARRSYSRSPRLDALRLHDGDTEEERAIEIVDHGVARVVLLDVGRAALESRMHVRGNQRRHHRLAGQIDTTNAAGDLHRIAAPDLGDHATLDEDGALLDRRRTVADDDPRALVESVRRQALTERHRDTGTELSAQSRDTKKGGRRRPSRRSRPSATNESLVDADSFRSGIRLTAEGRCEPRSSVSCAVWRSAACGPANRGGQLA